jgi:hypothetical protein
VLATSSPHGKPISETDTRHAPPANNRGATKKQKKIQPKKNIFVCGFFPPRFFFMAFLGVSR